MGASAKHHGSGWYACIRPATTAKCASAFVDPSVSEIRSSEPSAGTQLAVGTVGRDSGCACFCRCWVTRRHERLEERGSGGVALEQTVVIVIGVLLIV